ncbi:DNA polymerase III [Veillonella sp. oral taxon 158]|uniref:DNA polymerase III n=1 Tax=Veillonella sp. oral taxon 158 TaxID=671228 RepID=UPI002013C679|nr:DNA polymerase III [Veillonella sp. oral taxon 158]
MSIALMTFLKNNNLLVDIDPFNEDGSIKEDLIIRKSNVTNEGFQLFVKPVNNWWNALDRGTPPEKVTILENGLKKFVPRKINFIFSDDLNISFEAV